MSLGPIKPYFDMVLKESFIFIRHPVVQAVALTNPCNLKTWQILEARSWLKTLHEVGDG